MVWLSFLFAAPLFAQVDLTAIRELDEELPNYSDLKQSDEEVRISRQKRKYLPPKKIVPFEEIKKSGTALGALKVGMPLRHVETNEVTHTRKHMYVKYYALEDEEGFKYLQNKDGSTIWKVRSRHVEPIKEELSLYVPPPTYTPAPENIVKTVYDRRLKVVPEVSFSSGLVQGDYMADLFEDKKARSGLSNHYGLHFFTQWNHPIKVGAVIDYEKASYDLAGSGKILYSALSIGPQIKTRDFDILGNPIRFQAQLRGSPLAKAHAQTIYGSGTFKFNSTDLLASIERPIKNQWGEFVLGFYVQSQWLNIKDQTVPVSVKASNEVNRSFGLAFAQVFE